jgi:uncharacterized protein YbjT (DUF2867 family)
LQASLCFVETLKDWQMIVVTAPTGNIGHQVVENLLTAGAPVRVIVRDPARLSANVRDRVEVVQGTHDDEAVVNTAFKGAEAVFWLVPPQPRTDDIHAAYVGFSQAACAAFKAHDVARVVGVSALGRGTAWAGHAGLVTASLAMDDLIGGTGVNYRALTMPSFMDNIVRQAMPIKTQGMFFGPIAGDRKMPTCATADIAQTAARLLMDASWTGQGEAAVLGPEDISFDDMARVMTDVLGKPVRYQQIPFAAYKARFIEMGMSEAMAQGMEDMAMAKNAGLDNAAVRTPANTTPTPFQHWCETVLKPAVAA